ncbi:phage holin family protein [Candidatus Woesebacteria bacterium]|nr:phage holin family protein [Candidatus Woesebacteria bacterium]
MQVITQLIIQIFSLFIVSSILPGFVLTDIRSAIVAAVVIGVINTFFRPILQIVALPLTILTLGLFSFVINVLLLMLAASIVPGFKIDGFFTAAIASIVLTLISAFVHKSMKK